VFVGVYNPPAPPKEENLSPSFSMPTDGWEKRQRGAGFSWAYLCPGAIGHICGQCTCICKHITKYRISRVPRCDAGHMK
ncbi:hypothetical protein AMTR_s00063p00074060, partial [Amborella trichopoda]